MNIIKAVLHYPVDYDIRQDRSFNEFKKTFLPNLTIRTYSRENVYYRYIYYTGGKGKFEEDYAKYLYRQ
ncbi:MAG TPA: hypothetical protein PK079_05505 [Leptospiraceae bacterium]|nr:hypothetical protein [Leptospiraceae bacterium]HMW05051.1 hypothetical protein [Leptospiraceae bacterium]HMX31495.1 hypothetical protein [Leptospiraceae bacterium]HMY31652.1 hypothetical protein [Leptospiraceae bacterium]HMZ62604.1 hypothetical protein [Leptospiraceae bacterium]